MHVGFTSDSEGFAALPPIDANGMDRPCSRPEPLRG
jgi:hypothetical protein